MQELSLLNGIWKLVYTSNSELTPLLALGKLPLVTVGDVTQRIDSATRTVVNKVGPSFYPLLLRSERTNHHHP